MNAVVLEPTEGNPRVSWTPLVAAVLLAIWTLRLAVAEEAHSLLDWINLPFHEAGHLFLMPFGRTLHLLGGSLFQLFVPALLTGYFLLKRGPFSAAVCAWWLGQNFINVSVYMADARELKLGLVGGGEHDWNELFYRFGLLSHDSVVRVSAMTHHVGVTLMFAAVVWLGCLALPAGIREALGARLAGRIPLLRFLLRQAE